MAARMRPAVPLLHAVEARSSVSRECRVLLVGSRLTGDSRLRRRLGGEYQVSAPILS
jgi:hypothetical protein